MVIAAQLFVGGRQHERAVVDVDGTLRDKEWQPIDVEIVNLSSSGFCAKLPAAIGIAIGDKSSIGIAGLGVRPAYVVRVEPGIVACRFARNLPADYLQVIKARLPERAVAAASTIADAVYQSALPSIALPPPLAMGTRLSVVFGLALACWAAIGAVATGLGVISLPHF